MSGSRPLTSSLLTALALVAAVGPVAVDLYLPSFTDIADDLGVGAPAVQLTLTGFLLGVATGQLVLGPLSDRAGRRPVLVVALAVFALASVGIALSPTIEVFIALRVVQGFAGAAGMVLARAIAVDLSGPGSAVRPLSLIMMVVSLAGIIAPVIGGLLATGWGWRATLSGTAGLALALFLLAVAVVPESLSTAGRATGSGREAARALGGLLAEPGFLGYMLAFALGFGGLMAYLAASPFVAGVILGLDPVAYSLVFAMAGSGMVLATLGNAWVAPRLGPRRMLAIGQSMALGAVAVLFVLVLAQSLQVWSLVLLVFPLCAGSGLTMTNGSALALARAPAAARGAGSALLGASQFLVGAAVSPLVGLWGEGTALPMAVIVLLCVGAGMVAAALAGRVRPVG